jgi:hypothetical protein
MSYHNPNYDYLKSDHKAQTEANKKISDSTPFELKPLPAPILTESFYPDPIQNTNPYTAPNTNNYPNY